MNNKVCKNSLYTALIFDFFGICLMLFNYFVYNKDFGIQQLTIYYLAGCLWLLLCKNYFKKIKNSYSRLKIGILRLWRKNPRKDIYFICGQAKAIS